MERKTERELRAVLKYPGSKWRIAEWIVNQIPPHHSYIEPYFGSGAVFFKKQPSNIETINDLDDDVVNLFKIIRDNPKPLIKAVANTPYARMEYENAFAMKDEKNIDDVEKARLFLVRCWQGHGFRTYGEKVGWKNDVQGRERAYAVQHWCKLPGWINEIVDRLKQVQIEHRPAVEVIKRFNYSNCFIYADPPYVMSTRTRENYKHEMSEENHIELLDALIHHKGKCIISGYDNAMYNDFLQGWTKRQIANRDQLGRERTETILLNF